MSLPIIAEDSTVKRSFNTTRFSSGAPYTLAGTPSLHARVDGNATEVTAGFTLTADFDSKTGENQWILDLSASASYTAGAIVEVFIAAGTVDSVSVVGLKVYEFQIGTSGSLDALITRGLLALPAVAHSSSGGLPTVGTSTGQISVSSGQVILQAGTGTGQLDFTSGVVKANVTQFGGSAGTFASGRPEVNTTHAAGTAWNSGAIGPNTLASDTITAAKIAADAITDAKVASDVTIASVTGSVGSVTGNVGGNVVGSVGSVVSGVTLAASAVQAIWDAATSALTTAGSIGKRIVDYLTGDAYARLGAPAGASVSADIAAMKVDTAATLVDTNELQTDWTNGGRLDLLIDAILDDTGSSGVVVAAGSKSGYALSSSGTDLVLVDGKTLPAALQIIGASTAGKISGGGTGTEIFLGLDGSTTRITVTVDDDGNRSSVVYA